MGSPATRPKFFTVITQTHEWRFLRANPAIYHLTRTTSRLSQAGAIRSLEKCAGCVPTARRLRAPLDAIRGMAAARYTLLSLFRSGYGKNHSWKTTDIDGWRGQGAHKPASTSRAMRPISRVFSQLNSWPAPGRTFGEGAMKTTKASARSSGLTDVGTHTGIRGPTRH